MEGNAGNIHPDVYKAYSDNLRKAVGGVFRSDDYGDRYFDLQAQLQSNVTRFAAYKAYHLTEQLKKQREKWTDDDEYKKVAKAVLNTFNRYQAAEYNTATARARTAKQWTDFTSDPIANELYPNLKWLPSRSANPREEHMVFYNRVWAKSDPFWSENQPGNLWNCKCDWEETDDPVTDSNPTDAHHAKGLDGNPAETGEIFTKECTYFKQAGRNRRERDEVECTCESLGKIQAGQIAKQALLGKTAHCMVNGQQYDVEFIGRGIDHYARDIFGKKDIFWLKNEILPYIDEYISMAECVGRKASDTSHNTNKRTLQLKRQTDFFYYFRIMLPDGHDAYIHLGRFRESGNMYLYTITQKMPKEMEDL
ncbi:MAG: hypothetical protein IKN99_00200 [Bacteroidales bacterium]|nr:hypothetical protein [Bacteroidales bacterium]